MHAEHQSIPSLRGLAAGGSRIALVLLLGAVPSGPAHGNPYGDSERQPARGGGFSFGIDLTCLLTGCGRDRDAPRANEPATAEALARSGPRLPAAYTMSDLVLQGLVKGGAPFIVDCEALGAQLSVEVTLPGHEPFVTRFAVDGRVEKVFRLPETFGSAPQAARIAVRAVRSRGGRDVPAVMRLYALGSGEKAVGSVAIDQLEFGPSEVRIGRFGKARYRFHARSDFNRVVAEFSRLDNKDGVIQVAEPVRKIELGEMNRDSWIGRDTPRNWDGKRGDGEVSEGLHVLLVRAWRSSVREGDWIVAWSPDWVDIRW